MPNPFPATVITTSIGTLEVWATSANHLGIRTALPREEGTTADPYAIVNRVAYTIRFDINFKPGALNPYKDRAVADTGWSYEYNSLLMSRRNNWASPSPAAYRKAIEVLTAALVEFLDTPAADSLLSSADIRKTRSDIAATEAEIAALDAKRAELVAKLNAAKLYA